MTVVDECWLYCMYLVNRGRHDFIFVMLCIFEIVKSVDFHISFEGVFLALLKCLTKAYVCRTQVNLG